MKNIKNNYHHGDLKRALIDAGLAELEKKGVDAISMRGIAARVGVSHTAPKNHFDGVRGLLTAIAARGFELLVEDMLRDDGAPASGAFLDAGEGYIRFALENPELYKLMFSRTRTNGEDPDLKNASHLSYQVLQKIASDLGRHDDEASNGTRRTEWMLWSLVHGYAMLLIEGELERNEDGSPVLGITDLLRDLTMQKRA